MKIRIIKEFRGPGFITRVGETADSRLSEEPDKAEEWYKWLIDSGFAEEIVESGLWMPKMDEAYHYIDSGGNILRTVWKNFSNDRQRCSIGNCFKTPEATDRWLDYLNAVVTVRQDDGVLTPEQIRGKYCGSFIHYIGVYQDGQLDVAWKSPEDESTVSSAIYFDTKGHAQASLDKHPAEWKIIANYDWSRE